MVSKVVFLVLVGCAVAFGAAIEPNTIAPETEENLKFALEEIFEELADAVKNIVKEITEQIGDNINDDEVQKDLDEIKEAIEEDLKKQEEQHAVAESKRGKREATEEDVQQASEEELKHVGHDLKELFQRLVDEISKRLGENIEKDSDKEKLEKIKEYLKHIFDRKEE